MSLNKVFSELQVNKSNFLNCKTGDDFEQRIITSLKANGFNHMVKGTNSEIDFFIEKIKLSVLDKLSMIYIKNTTSIKDAFFSQPYGSQEFPDFLVFTEFNVLLIDVKYSNEKQDRPMWNGNLPKNNAFYIFASRKYKNSGDITFFQGKDILSQEHREILVSYWDQIRAYSIKLKKNFPICNFDTYTRETYNQSSSCFDNDRFTREQNLLTEIGNL